MSLPYKTPVKLHVFHRQWVIRDPYMREVFEIKMNSLDIGYWKRMESMGNLLVDLLNGKKHIQYDPGTKSCSAWVHDYDKKEEVAVVETGPAEPESNGHNPEEVPGVIDKIVAAVKKKRGRPKRK